MTTELNAALHRFLGVSRSAVMLAQIEDLMEMHTPINVPGTFQDHRNWQRKLRWPLEGLFARRTVSDICRSIAEARQCA